LTHQRRTIAATASTEGHRHQMILHRHQGVPAPAYPCPCRGLEQGRNHQPARLLRRLSGRHHGCLPGCHPGHQPDHHWRGLLLGRRPRCHHDRVPGRRPGHDHRQRRSDCQTQESPCHGTGRLSAPEQCRRCPAWALLPTMLAAPRARPKIGMWSAPSRWRPTSHRAG
jgi:hypothetical protein